MTKNSSKFSPILFAVACVCFFLPFVEISCQGQKLGTITGVQMVTGTEVQQPSMFGQRADVKRVEPEPLAVVASLAALLGLAIAFLKLNIKPIISIITAAAGLVSLIVLKSKIDAEVLRESQGLLQVNYGLGFWLALLSFLAAGVLSATNFFIKNGESKETKKLATADTNE